MKELFKTGFDTIVKMCITQLGMTMFALIIAMATVNNTVLLIGSSIVAILLYLFLLYVHTWALGASDKIKVDGGRMKYVPLKGLYLSLIANSLNIVLAVFANIGYWFLQPGQTGGWQANMYSISNMLAKFLESMYVGLLRVCFPDNNPIWLFVIVIPALLISQLAYYKGMHNSWSLGLDKPANNKKK